MNPINLKSFRQYENAPSDSGPAKVGHVNYVIFSTLSTYLILNITLIFNN